MSDRNRTCINEGKKKADTCTAQLTGDGWSGGIRPQKQNKPDACS